MKAIAVATLAVLLTGCTSTQPPQRYHVLDAPPASARAVPAAESAQTLLVLPTTAEAFYDAEAIVYSRAPGLRSHYQINSWTERPSHRIGTLLTQRLAASGAFHGVAGTADGVPGTLVLATHLEELYHDATGTPGSVRIVLTAVLTDPGRRTIVSRRTFTARAAAPSDDAAGAVRGMAVALGPLLDEVVAWTGSAAQSGADASIAQAARAGRSRTN